MKPLQVLAVASEIFPLIKTGGLADVVGALPAALTRENVRVRTLVPGYPAVMAAIEAPAVVREMEDLFGGPARILAGKAGALELFVLDAPHLFSRGGGPYADSGGRDWPDNPQRFAALARIGADIGGGALPDYAPDIVHAHDWQAGLTSAYLRHAAGAHPGTVMTIHNLAFQGQFQADLFPSLGLPREAFGINGIEYHGDIGYLKAGIYYADRITTVSPSYAEEIRTSDAGMGLDGLLRSRGAVVSGILNGIDTEAWNPATDTAIAAPFSAKRIGQRAANKAELQSQFFLEPDETAPLFAVVSRLSWQKGLDLLLEALPTLLAAGAQLAVLGSGEPHLEDAFRSAAWFNPGRIGCRTGYHEETAHLVQAGCDAILVPSRFEPCGLTQLCALRYGAVPVVARVGGLADSVIDANPAALGSGVATGVQFSPVTGEMLRIAIERTVALYRQPAAWRKIQANGMASDFSWNEPARRYATLFRDLLAERQ